jgi:hypothetical protein
MFGAALLDIGSGEAVWSDAEVYEGTEHPHPAPTFSEDGGFLAAYFHRRVVVIDVSLPPHSGFKHACEIPEDMELSAIAIGRNGKRIGVSTIMPLGQMNSEPTATLKMRKLVNPMTDTGHSHIDVVETSFISNISLTYGSNGTRLVLVGNAVATNLSVTITSGRCCWDTASRCLFCPLEFTGLEVHRCSPLAIQRDKMPALFMNTVELYNRVRESYLLRYSEDEGVRAVLSSQMLVGGFTPSGFLFFAKSWLGVFSEGGQWAFFRKEMVMIEKDRSSRYLWRLDIETSKVICFAKILWDNLPPLEMVKTLAETEEGLTLILKNGQLVFFDCWHGDEVVDRVASALYIPSIFKTDLFK